MTGSTDMMSCEEVLARLWEFLDGELPSADEAAVKKHLEMCDRCFPRYDFRRAYLEFMRRVREGDRVPAARRRRLFEKILEQEASEETGS